MTFARWGVSLFMAALSACLGQSPAIPGADGQGKETIVAQVGKEKVTLGDLEQQSAKLLQARYQYYLAQRDALQALIDDRLLNAQAARENITVAALLEREVNGKVTDPTEDQLAVYYEGLETDKQFPEVRDQILRTIRQLRLNKARAAYIKSLRNNNAVSVTLRSPKAEVAVENSPIRGPKDAAVTIVEFADYECPYCQQVNPYLKKIEEQFRGKVALSYKHFPLPMHPDAMKASEAANCAAAQGKFWEYHDLLFEGRNYASPRLKEYARTLRLDNAVFDQCLDSAQQQGAVQKDLAQAQLLGLTGTPSFFINGHFISGAVSYETLRDMVEEELAAKVGPRRQVESALNTTQ